MTPELGFASETAMRAFGRRAGFGRREQERESGSLGLLGSPRTRRTLGAAALLLVSFVLVWPVARSRSQPPSSAREVAPTLATPPEDLALAQSSVAALQVASDALKGAATSALAARSASRAPPPAVAAAETDEATQCLEALVPELTFGAGRLDWVCAQPDLWQLHLDLYGRAVSRGSGRGVALWMQLGRFELGAIAILRARCCPDARPVVAEVATAHCGSLSEVASALGAEPSSEHVQRYEETMQCLADRKVRLPEAWEPISDAQARRFFGKFLEGAREK